MKKIIVFCILIFFIKVINGQELISFKQRTKFSSLIINYSQKYSLDLNNTIFLILHPNVCPRCEDLIPQISEDFNKFKTKNNNKSKFVLLVLTDEKNVAIQSASKLKKYFNETIVRLEDENELLVLNNGILSFPLLTRFDINGNIVNYNFLSGFVELNWEKFYDEQDKIELTSESYFNTSSFLKYDTLLFDEILEIDFRTESMNIYDISLYNEHLLIIDDANENINLLTNNSKIKLNLNLNNIDTFIRNKNVQLSDKDFNKLKEYGMFSPIYLKIIKDATNIYLIGSIVKLEYSEGNKEKILNYVVPFKALIKKENNNLILDNFKELVSKHPFDSINSIDHTNMVISNDSIFIYGYMKGIPIFGTHMSDTTENPRYNPFNNGFYNSTPLFEVYNNDKFVKVIENLDSVFIRNKMGYSNTLSTIKKIDNKYYTSDGYRNYINEYDENFNFLKSYKFERYTKANLDTFEVSVVRSPNHFFKFDNLIGSYVTDFYLHNGDLYTIEIVTNYGPSITKNALGYLYTIHKKNGTKNKYFIPIKINKTTSLQKIQFESNMLNVFLYDRLRNKLITKQKKL